MKKVVKFAVIFLVLVIFVALVTFGVRQFGIYSSKTNYPNTMTISLTPQNVAYIDVTTAEGETTSFTYLETRQLWNDIFDMFTGEYTYRSTICLSDPDAEHPMLMSVYDSERNLIEEIYYGSGLVFISAGNNYFHGYINKETGMLDFSALKR